MTIPAHDFVAQLGIILLARVILFVFFEEGGERSCCGLYASRYSMGGVTIRILDISISHDDSSCMILCMCEVACS